MKFSKPRTTHYFGLCYSLIQVIQLFSNLLFQRGLLPNIGHAECERLSMELRDRIHFHRIHLRRGWIRHVPPRQKTVDHGLYLLNHLRIRYVHSLLWCSGFLSPETQQSNAQENYTIHLIWFRCELVNNYDKQGNRTSATSWNFKILTHFYFVSPFTRVENHDQRLSQKHRWLTCLEVGGTRYGRQRSQLNPRLNRCPFIVDYRILLLSPAQILGREVLRKKEIRNQGKQRGRRRFLSGISNLYERLFVLWRLPKGVVI